MHSGEKTPFLEWDRNTRAPSPPPPPLSCDCQFHIYDDPKAYPPKPGALYDPPRATFEDMRGVLRKLGFARGVIVHAMPYDTDHRLLIDTLSGVADRENIRAVAFGDVEPCAGEESNVGEGVVFAPNGVKVASQRRKILNRNLKSRIWGPQVNKTFRVRIRQSPYQYCINQTED